MNAIRSRTAGAFAAIAGSICFSIFSTNVNADSSRELNLDEQPLADSLKNVADEFGLEIAFFSDTTEGLEAVPLTGNYTSVQAFDALLDDTSLEHRQLDNGTVVVRRKQERGDSDSKNLSPVPVMIAQNAHQTTRTETTNNGGTSIVTGKVTDVRTGANLKGAKVTIEETGEWTSTNDLGEFRIVNVPKGSVTLTVSYLGYAGQSAIIGVRGGGVSQNFALRGGSDIEEIVVFGQRSARAISLNEERTADNFSTVLSGDFLGQFDGTTISEALRRAPGVAFEQDTQSGDGTNIIVRGLSADFNMVTFNGLRVPEGTGQGRGPDLSNLLADSVAKITLSKTLLASQDSSGTGALVNIETKRPFDRPRRFASVGYEVGQTSDDFIDDESVTATISGIFGDNESVGASASFQYRQRDIRRLDYNTVYRFGKYLPIVEGQPIPDIGVLDPREIQFPYEPGVTEGYVTAVQNNYGNLSTDNLAATFSLDWQVARHTLLSFDYTRFEKTTDSITRSVFAEIPLVDRVLVPIEELGGEERFALVWEDIAAPLGVPGLLFSVRHTLADLRDQENNTDAISLRGKTDIDRLSLSYSAGFTRGVTESPFDAFLQLSQPFLSIVTALEESYLDPSARSPENTVAGLIISPWAERSGVNEYPLPMFSEAGFEYYNNASNYFINEGSVVFNEGSNERTTARIDAKYNFDSDLMPYLEAGIFFESADFRNDRFVTADLLTTNNPTLDDIGLSLSAENLAPIGVNSGFNTVRERDLTLFFSQLDEIAAANPNISLNLRNQNGNENLLFAGRRTSEDEFAAYFQVRLNFGRLELFPGLRASRVEIDTLTPQVPTITDENGVFDTAFRDANARLVNLDASQSEVLPRFLFNYRFDDNLILRGGYFKTLARPQIELMSSNNQLRLDLRPIFGLLNRPRLEIQAGNPDLQPAKTDNWDLSVEYYDKAIGAAKLSVFYKETDNLIENNEIGDVSGLSGVVLPDDRRFQELPDNLLIIRSQPINSPGTSRLWGAELSLEKQFDFLPSPFDGLGAWFNYTYSESSKLERRSAFFSGGLISFDVRTRYQGQPDDSGTFALTYNKNNVDASISYTRQDTRQIGTVNTGVNPFNDRDETLDLRVQYLFEVGNILVSAYIEGADLLKDSSDPDVENFLGGERSLPRYYRGASYFGGRMIRLGASATF